MTTKEERAKDTIDRMEKLKKKIPADMLQAVADLDATALREHVVLCQAQLAENEREHDADEDLATAKDTYQQAALPYKKQKTIQTALAAYCSLLIELKE